MDEKANPYGVLETLEESKNEIPESGEAGSHPFQRRYPCELKKRLLADSRQPDSTNRPIKPKVRKGWFSVLQFLLQNCYGVK